MKNRKNRHRTWIKTWIRAWIRTRIRTWIRTWIRIPENTAFLFVNYGAEKGTPQKAQEVTSNII